MRLVGTPFALATHVSPQISRLSGNPPCCPLLRRKPLPPHYFPALTAFLSPSAPLLRAVRRFRRVIVTLRTCENCDLEEHDLVRRASAQGAPARLFLKRMSDCGEATAENPHPARL